MKTMISSYRVPAKPASLVRSKAHSLSIYGDSFQIDCGACPHTCEVHQTELSTLIEGDMAGSDNCRQLFRCPKCGTRAEVQLDRFDQRGTAYATETWVML